MYQDQVPIIPGTRLLQPTLGVVGRAFRDPHDARRVWEVQGLFAPIPGRALGGLRAKLMDQKGFVSFCNQRDFEVLIGSARPGDYCPWAKTDYFAPTDAEWFGICADENDLLDDLLERELLYRAHYPNGVLYGSIDFERRIHTEHGMDFEEQWVFLQDVCPETGFFPDTRFDTLESRWARADRKRVNWNHVY